MDENTNTTAANAQGANPPAAQEPAPEAQASGPQIFTQEDVDRIISRRHAQFERQMEQRVAQARKEGRAEAERLAKMTEEQRAQHDLQVANEREENLRNREAALIRRELRAEAVDTLISRGLPRELDQMLDYTDSESCARSIDALENIFRSAVQRGVDERIQRSGSPLPKPGADPQAATIARMRAAVGLKNE